MPIVSPSKAGEGACFGKHTLPSCKIILPGDPKPCSGVHLHGREIIALASQTQALIAGQVFHHLMQLTCAHSKLHQPSSSVALATSGGAHQDGLSVGCPPQTTCARPSGDVTRLIRMVKP